MDIYVKHLQSAVMCGFFRRAQIKNKQNIQEPDAMDLENSKNVCLFMKLDAFQIIDNTNYLFNGLCKIVHGS